MKRISDFFSSLICSWPQLCLLKIANIVNNFFYSKQNELDALNGAHSNRLQRYKNLQHEYKIVLELLKTFENLR